MNPPKTPLYQPSFNPKLSPREIYKETEPEKPSPKPAAAPPVYEEFNRATYKELTDDEKNLMCAGIVLSANYRKFLKPYLEAFTNPPRRPIKSDADYYQLLNDNAEAAFATSLIATLEGRAKRSPSYQYPIEEEI